MIWCEGHQFPTDLTMKQKNPLANTTKPCNNEFQGINRTYQLLAMPVTVNIKVKRDK